MAYKWFGFLEQFLNCGTPSGFEDKGQKMWLNYVSSFCDKADTDSMGNAWAWYTPPVDNKNVIMVAGHCDEIGLMVTHITDKGYLHFIPIGGIDAEILFGSKIEFLNSGVVGVIGRKPIHLQDDGNEKTKTKFRELWIDIGASSKEEALKSVPIGSVAYIQSKCSLLLNGLLTSRGLDDKLGSFIAARVVEIAVKDRQCSSSIVGVSTVQEEIGLCGAKVVAQKLKPNVAIVVDVGFASDTPDDDDAKTVGDISIGKGPMINIGAASNRVLRECFSKAAEELGISIQIVPDPNETGTDADSIRLSGIGIPTINVSIPVRYMHTPVEVCSLKDVDDIVNLISGAVKHISEVYSFNPF